MDVTTNTYPNFSFRGLSGHYCCYQVLMSRQRCTRHGWQGTEALKGQRVLCKIEICYLIRMT